MSKFDLESLASDGLVDDQFKCVRPSRFDLELVVLSRVPPKGAKSNCARLNLGLSQTGFLLSRTKLDHLSETWSDLSWVRA